MKPKMKKWLTGLLSAALLAGNLPAYAGSVYAAEFVSTEKEVEENFGEEDNLTADFSDAEGFSDGNTEDGILSDEELFDAQQTDELAGWESAATVADAVPEDLQDQNGYLEHLSLYDSNNASSPLNLTRQADLDVQFGGKVYVAEYGSHMDSSAFWITADLSSSAPEGATVQIQATDLNGQVQTKDMAADGYTQGIRYNLGAGIFAAGKNGSKGAVYTITAGTQENRQIYQILVKRRLDLQDIRAFLPTDTDLAKNILQPKFDTSGRTRDYEATVPVSVSSIHLTAAAFSDNWYGLKVTSKAAEAVKATDISFSTDTSAADIMLSHTGDTVITFFMEEENTYEAPAYEAQNYTSQGTYTITIHKQSNATVAFQITPDDAVISVYGADGNRLNSSGSSWRIYDSILQGETYSWNVSRYGYISVQGSFTGGQQSEITVALEKQDAKQTELTDNEWISFRNNDNNNGLTDTQTPTDPNATVQKWAKQIGVGGEASVTPPLILGGNIYVASGQFIYKLDKNTGEILARSEQLKGSMEYAMNPLCYGEGMLFAQIGGGQIQAISATSLKSLWISESVGGQTISPITYKDGYLYTGTWNSKTTAGTYFCLSVTDEDPAREDEIKYCTWKYNHKGGFYWAGAYVSGDYLVFGSDNGVADKTGEKINSNPSVLYSVNTHTGMLLDKLTNLRGDIRSTVVYNNGYAYFTTKGGYLYRVYMNADGTFGNVTGYNLGGMATGAPVVHKGRIYIGVAGSGGQFSSDGGHHFDVLNESDSGITKAYSVTIPGYSQAAPLVSTAYENQDFDGDGVADGRVYLYFTYNSLPGGIYMLEDAPGRSSGKAVELFRPAANQQQYCISTICVDKDGTLYYKNDSNYLMALETNGAYLDSVSAISDGGAVTWPSAFRKDTLEYKLKIPENAKKVTFTLKVPTGCTMTANGQSCNGTYTVDTSSGSSDVTVNVNAAGKSRSYLFHLVWDRSVPVFEKMAVSTSNTYSNVANHLEISPVFNSAITSYRVIYTGTREFLNIFAELSDSTATVTAEGISGTGKIVVLGKVTGSGNAHRIAMYFDPGKPLAEAKVKLTVTAKSGKKTEYILVIQRTDTLSPTPTATPTPTPTQIPEVFGPWKTASQATVFAPEKQQRSSNKGRTETRTVGSKLAPTIKVNAKTVKLKVKQSTSKLKVTGLANGDSIKSWTSSNRKVVSVSKKGTIKGLKAGKAKVTVTLASNKKKTINVIVQKTAVKTEKITGLKSKVTLKRGKKYTLKPTITPFTSQEKVTYTSSNKKVASVTLKGVITARKKGTARITVKSGKKRFVVTVKVKN